MLFCPKCGSLMLPKLIKGKQTTVCGCGFTHTGVTESMVVKEKGLSKRIVEAVDETSDDNRLPITTTECETCGHKKAFYWTVQTRAGDEAETKFLKCEKCKHTWREYN